MPSLRIKEKPIYYTPDFCKGTFEDYDICIRSFGGTEARIKKDGNRSDKHFGRCYKKGEPINDFLPNITEDYVPCVLIKCFRKIDEVFTIMDDIDFIKVCDYLSTPSLSYWEVVKYYNLEKENRNEG